MGFNGNKITEYKDGNTPETGTPALGSTFNAEFNRLYDNDTYLKAEVDKLGGATLDPDTGLASNSDLKIPSQHAVKTFVESQIAGHDTQHDDRYYTETESDARFVKLTGAQTVAGIKTFSSIPVLPATNPTAVNEATRKEFVMGRYTLTTEDLNTVILPGSYRLNSGQANCPTAANYGQLLVIRGSAGDTITQIVTGWTSNYIAYRSGNPSQTGGAGVWNGWVELTSRVYVDGLDAANVKLTGAQTIAGVKTFSSIPVLPATAPTAANEATRKGYVDGLDAANVKITGAQTVAGVKTFSSIPVLPATNPTAANEAVRKSYVDETVINPMKRFKGLLNGTVSHATIYEALGPLIPEIGDIIPLSGAIFGGVYVIILSHAERTSSTEIWYRGLDTNNNLSGGNAQAAWTTSYVRASFSW